MSEPRDKQAPPQEQEQEPETGAAPPAQEQLAGLMSPRAAPDLERQALAAAEAALLQGQRALAEARAQMAAPGPPRASRARELALRIVLAVNLLAMATVVLWPAPARPAPSPGGPQPGETAAPPHDPVVQRPSLDDPVIRAFAAADQRDYQTAIRLLEDHLQASPHLAPAKRANLMLALEHYASQIGDFTRAQDWQRKAEALRNSHSLPEDLLAMAAAAEKSGDVESMRRYYARLLLQQRQIPSALYRHVAEAYLRLGDSYRQEAEQGAAAARAAELEQLRQRLRQQGDGERRGK